MGIYITRIARVLSYIGLALFGVVRSVNATAIQQISGPQSTASLSDAFVGNGLVAWQSGTELNLYNISTGITSQYSVSGSLQGFDGFNAVLTNGSSAVDVFNVTSQSEYQIATLGAAQAAISGNYVVYAPVLGAVNGFENIQLNLYNISTQATTQLNNPVSANEDPSVNSNGQVSWDQRFPGGPNGETVQVAYYDGASYNYNLSATSSDVLSELPSISTSIIAYDEYVPAENAKEMFVYSIANGTNEQVSQNIYGLPNTWARADGENVVWQATDGNATYNIMMFNGFSTDVLTSYSPYYVGIKSPFLDGNSFPDISGNDVVWIAAGSNSTSPAVYLAILPEPGSEAEMILIATIAVIFWRNRFGERLVS